MQTYRVKPRSVRSLKSIITLFAAITASIYVSLFIALYCAQRQLIFPGSVSQGSPDARLDARNGAEVCTLLTPQLHDRIPAYYGAALLPDGSADSDAKKRLTVLFFHGNGGSINDYLPIFQHFRLLGVNVLMPEYPGYGMADGVASEAGCDDAAEAAYQELLHTHGLSPDKIVATGWSLGSGVAIDLAARHKLAGLATFSAYTSMAEMGSFQYPIFPASVIRLALKHKFLSEKKIPGVHCPVFISHGEDDRTIPVSMSHRLAKAAGGQVTFLALPGIAHNNFFDEGGERLYPALGQWLHGLETEPEKDSDKFRAKA